METMNNYTTFILIIIIVFLTKHFVDKYNLKLENKSVPRLSVNGILQDAIIKASITSQSVLIATGVTYILQKFKPDITIIIAALGSMFIYCVITDVVLDVIIKPSFKARRVLLFFTNSFIAICYAFIFLNLTHIK